MNITTYLLFHSHEQTPPVTGQVQLKWSGTGSVPLLKTTKFVISWTNVQPKIVLFAHDFYIVHRNVSLYVFQSLCHQNFYIVQGIFISIEEPYTPLLLTGLVDSRTCLCLFDTGKL